LLGEVSFFAFEREDTGTSAASGGSGCDPGQGSPDAAHIAAAAVEECEFLLTWNFRHIANIRIRREMGGFFRTMATPKRPSVRRKSLSEQKPWEDEVLQEVYAERDSYAAEHGYDLDQIYADLKRREASSDHLRWSDSRPLA
jgi:hypothetical protein